MEKKSKFPQSSSKGASSSDAKKSQADVVGSSRPYPKSSRKREPPNGTSNFVKYDQPKKSFAQKGKNFDKRPKPKGYYYGSSKEDSKVVGEETAEPGSVMNQGSKKQNLNHLLNFHYAPRDMRNGSEAWNRRRTSNYNHNSNRWLPPVQRHKYNKEQFLQANCQFIVNANADYTTNLADPDTLVDWKLVEQIRLHTPDRLSCPICLSSPVAGKMTRCGHVYCWSCILHYLALSDKSWRKCPICYESVHKSDLKSVVEITQNVMNIGDVVRLRLMRRERGSLIATSVPAEEKEIPAPTDFFSVSEANSQHCQVYSKLLLANVGDVMDIVECERVQLKLELDDDPHSPENCFIEQALEELQARERELLILMGPKEITTTTLTTTLQSKKLTEEDLAQKKCEEEQTNNQSELEEGIQIENNDNNHNSGEIAMDPGSKTSGVESPPQLETVKSWWNGEECELVVDSKTETCMKNIPPPSKEETDSFASNSLTSYNAQKFFHFYQAENGQHVYLHGMNAKMLEMQYGSLDQCPRVITGKLLEKEDGSFTEELRRRMKYLCHLPLTCQFEIAEIELLPPLVSEDVIKQFQDQLETRQRKRKRKEKEEQKREKKINEEENKRMGKFPTRKVHIESRRHFPQWHSETPQNPAAAAGISIPSIPPPESTTTSRSTSVASSPSSSSFDEVPSLVEEPMISWPSNNADSGPSFAQMLRQTGNRAAVDGNIAWPSTKGQSNVAMPPATNQLDEDGYVSLRTYNPTFGDALAQALEQSTVLDTAVDKPREGSAGGGNKKKKKKNKPTVLFATGMAHAS